MKNFTLILVCCYILFPSLHRVLSLKCRTGNQQSDDQFQKIMQVCRRRFLGYDRDAGGRDTDSQESSDLDSDEDVFDNKFLNTGGSRNNKNGQGRSSAGGRSDGSRNATRRNWRSSDQRPYDNYQANSSSRRNMRTGGYESDSGYSNRYNSGSSNNNNNNRNNYYNNMSRSGNGNSNGNNNNGDDYNSDGEREQACVIQCFFNELNLVDQRGFPERSAVIGIMTQSIQDSELRDFVEESVIECYHYLNNNGRQEKCQFSQNLLSCLAEKGSETFKFSEM